MQILIGIRKKYPWYYVWTYKNTIVSTKYRTHYFVENKIRLFTCSDRKIGSIRIIFKSIRPWTGTSNRVYQILSKYLKSLRRLGWKEKQDGQTSLESDILMKFVTLTCFDSRMKAIEGVFKNFRRNSLSNSISTFKIGIKKTCFGWFMAFLNPLSHLCAINRCHFP